MRTLTTMLLGSELNLKEKKDKDNLTENKAKCGQVIMNT